MDQAKKLVETIIKGIQEKKGSGIVVVDMNGLDGSICKYFVICQGNSPTQVDAITDSVEEFTRINSGEKPVRVVGRENAREYYNLENLWQDAKVTVVPDLD